MSISTNSINYGDDLTPAENAEGNGDAISLGKDGQFDGKKNESITDQQQLKEFRDKFAKMEMELKMAKLEFENKALEQKLKHEEMMGEQKALKEKVAKIEQEKEKNAIFPNMSTSEEMSVLIAIIAELNRAKTIEPSIASSTDLFEQDGNGSDDDDFRLDDQNGQEKEERKTPTNETTSDQFSKMQNDQKTLLEKVSELDKEQKQKTEHLNFQQNFWDANVCHENLEIIGDKNLTVHHKGTVTGLWRSVFSKHSSSDVFGQDGNGLDENEFRLDSEKGQKQEEREKTTNDVRGMQKEMTVLFILTVVNIMVTVAVIIFITLYSMKNQTENARINAEFESLKKFVEMEQQHGNDWGF